jgi:hypothetical protein
LDLILISGFHVQLFFIFHPTSKISFPQNLTLFLGDLAEVIGKKIYPRITPKLYEILGKLGDPSHYVSQSAWVTLTRIAHLESVRG